MKHVLDLSDEEIKNLEDKTTGRVDLRYNPYSVEIGINIPRGLDTEEEYRERVDRIMKKHFPNELERRRNK